MAWFSGFAGSQQMPSRRLACQTGSASGRQIIVEATMEYPAAAQQSPPRAAHRFDGQTTVHLLRGDAARLHTPHRGLDLISGRLITQAQTVR
jgi:hypothetical protein